MTNPNELRLFVEDLRAADVQDDRAFHSLLSRGVELLRLLDKDIAQEFGVSRPTVTRWRNGTNAPHPAMRRPVYNLLEHRAAAILKRNARRTAATRRSSSGAAAPVAAVAVACKPTDD